MKEKIINIANKVFKWVFMPLVVLIVVVMFMTVTETPIDDAITFISGIIFGLIIGEMIRG